MTRWTTNLNQDRLPNVCLFYDSESDVNNPKDILLITFVIVNNNLDIIENTFPTFNGISECSADDFPLLIRHLLTKYHRVRVYAHNGSRWDHHLCLFHHFNTKSERITNLTYMDVSVGRNKLEIRDSLLFFPMSLKKIGQLVNLPKLDMDFNLMHSGNLELFREYARRDTEILLAAFHWLQDNVVPLIGKYKILQFNSMAHIGLIKMTINSAFPFYQFDNPSDFYKLQQCYYGARVCSNQYGEITDEPFGILDLRSMYASALTGQYPTGPLKPPYKTDVLPANCLYIAKVRLTKERSTCRSQTHPLLPVHVKDGLMYADSGDYTGWYTSVDIRTALADGWRLETIFIIYEFESHDYVFKTIVNDLYNTRAKLPASNPMNPAIKLILNAAYGKFGQYNNVEEERVHCRPHYIAWFVLSYSRRILLRCKQQIKADLKYGDTDSFFVNLSEIERLRTVPGIFNNELSDIRLGTIRLNDEGHYRQLGVLAKKTYFCVGETIKVAAKGLPKITYEQLLEGMSKDVIVTYENSPDHFTEGRNFYVARIQNVTRTLRVNIPFYVYLCDKCPYLHPGYCIKK